MSIVTGLAGAQRGGPQSSWLQSLPPHTRTLTQDASGGTHMHATLRSEALSTAAGLASKTRPRSVRLPLCARRLPYIRSRARMDLHMLRSVSGRRQTDHYMNADEKNRVIKIFILCLSFFKASICVWVCFVGNIETSKEASNLVLDR